MNLQPIYQKHYYSLMVTKFNTFRSDGKGLVRRKTNAEFNSEQENTEFFCEQELKWWTRCRIYMVRRNCV